MTFWLVVFALNIALCVAMWVVIPVFLLLVEEDPQREFRPIKVGCLTVRVYALITVFRTLTTYFDLTVSRSDFKLWAIVRRECSLEETRVP